MKTNINFFEFRNWFEKNRPNNFSKAGVVALWEYLEGYEEDTGEELEFDPIAVVGSDTGVRLIDTTKKNSAFNKNFAKEIKEISSNFGTNANDIKFGTGSSNYFEMDKYVKNINPESKSKIIDSLDNTLPGLANEMNKLDIKFAKEYGYDLSPVILTIRKAISTDGLKGLTALIASGAVPSVVASEITPLLEKHDN